MTTEKCARPAIRLVGRAVILTCVVLGFQGVASAARNPSGKLLLVEDGISRAPIVVFEDAPPFTIRAATELAEYIEKTSGAKPAVILGEPDPVPDHAVWVGYQPVMDGLFPDIDFNFEHPEEILIAATEDHLAIAGRDRWDADNLVVEGRNSMIEGMQQEYGTANAVYTFIQDYLGVRWLWPGETGEDVLERKAIAFAPFRYRYHPQIRARRGLFRLSALGDGRGHSHDWVRRQRLQLDSLNQPGGHAYGSWFGRFHDKHPEYFALQPDGTRSGFPGGGRAKLCQANPEVWKQWAKDVAQRLQERPYQRVFNGSPNDSCYSGICICDDCRAWDHPDAAPCRYHWQDLSQEYVALSDRYVTFANHLGRTLKERYPDKDYYVLMLAYGDTSKPPPVEAVPDPNVVIGSVHCFQRELGAEREALMKQFADWAKVAPHIMWRPNLGGAGWHVALPDCVPRQVIEDLRFLAENNCKGLCFDTIWEHWATHGPHLYMLGRMAWNPYADGEAILADYYKRGFGPAAREIEAYWTLLAEKRNEMVRKGINRHSSPKVLTPEVLDQAEGLLERAAQKVAGRPKYAERVKFVRAGCAYTRSLVRARALMMQMEEAGAQDAETVNKIKALWERITRVCEDNPKGFNTYFIRSHQRWMRGFHPENPM